MSQLFITAWGDLPAGGIYTFDIKDSGEPVQRAFTPFRHAGYIAWSADGRFMYVTGGGEETDTVGAFSVADDGKCTQLSVQSSGGVSCCHLCVSPDGKFVYAANYRTGNFAEFPVRADGSPAPARRIVTHEGKGPHPVRQTEPHAHFCGFSPDGKYLLVIDLGIDAVMAYPFAPEEGIVPEHVIKNPVTPGSGPRHLVFDKSGRTAWLVTELGNTILRLAYEDGRFEVLETYSTLPRGVRCATKASAVRLSRDGKILLASNRGFDDIAVFSADGTGKLVPVSHTLSGGSSPRDVNFFADDRFVAAGNEASGNVFFFDFDRERGTLTPNGFRLDLPRPLCFSERPGPKKR